MGGAILVECRRSVRGGDAALIMVRDVHARNGCGATLVRPVSTT